MWLSTATGSRSDSESDEEDLPVGDEVCKRGYLRKQKHGHWRYFVLKLDTADAPARLEYYENARKFRHSVRAAAAAAAAAASGATVPALIAPRRVITLYQCFSVSQRADARYPHLIALFTQNEYFAMVAENESEQESWYLLLSRLILESKRRRCGTLGAQPEGEPAALAAAAAAEPPFYKDVWQVIVKPRGLGHRKELSGVFRLCLTDEEVLFVRLNTEVASVVVQLLSIRRCGHSEQYFFLEVGRSTVIGPGELWMQVDDCVVAQNMHELFLEKMRALCADEYRARCRSYSISISGHLLTLLSTRRHLDMLPLEPGGWLRRSRFEQFCHLWAIGDDGEDEMLLSRRYITPNEPVPPSRQGRLHLPRGRRSRRATSVPASFFRRAAPSPVRIQCPTEALHDRDPVSPEASGSGSGNSGEEGGPQGKEDQEENEGDYMPMNNWGSGNGRGSGSGQGSSGQGSSSQSSGGSQCSGRGHGSGGGQGSSGSHGSSGRGSGEQSAGGNQCSGDGQGTAGHGSGSGQGAGGGHGSGRGQGPGDGHGSGGGKNSGGGKGSGSGKGPEGNDRGATKERKEAKEVKDTEPPEGAARGPHRARAFDEDEDDPYVPMRPGVAAPLASSSDYMPMAPQNVSVSKKRHSRSPFEDSRGYMMMFPRVSPPPVPSPPKAPDPAKEDDSKDNDSDRNKVKPKPQKPTQEQREADSPGGYVNIDFPKRGYNMPDPCLQRLPGVWGIIADPRQFAFSNYVNVEFGVPFPNPADNLSDLFRAIPGANPFFLEGATGSTANREEGDYIEVIFNPAMTPAVPFADSAIRYDAETGRIYVVDPFCECCMNISLSPSRCCERPPVARLLLREELERRRPQSRSQSFFAAARAAISAFPTDSLERDLSASFAAAAAAVPTLAVGRALAAASALVAAPGIGAAAAGLEAAAGFDSASVRWFLPVANAAGAAVRGAQDVAGGSNRRAPNPSADLAGGENRAGGAAAAAAAPPPSPGRGRVPRPPEREDSDDDDTYSRCRLPPFAIMIIYRDLISHEEMFSDIYKIREVADGLCLEVEGKMVSRTEGNIDDSLIGGNASAEGPEGQGTDNPLITGVDIVMNHHLQETSFTKEAYKKYIKNYMKRILGGTT
ncbi:hypothetical protein Celaphus_00009781 [Cervus elaphus hippelaphus]|uniref:Insulin receptor substrate 4 n=1 Tax=Cervus elaphus hippelaphus TaxID=46360 RepID=A0A212BZK3_CEREH|nr:hypothetical protein Celaphus_00009781 [Cervus elaphus hippelaphus]